MKFVFCANCGTRLNITRKAIPKYATIIDVVEFHECPEEPIPLDLTPIDIPSFKVKEDKNKFVENLNDLVPKSILAAMGAPDLRDRRDEKDVKELGKTSAPDGLTSMIDNLQPTQPASDPGKEPENG